MGRELLREFARLGGYLFYEGQNLRRILPDSAGFLGREDP
jgi:hypothetical protein